MEQMLFTYGEKGLVAGCFVYLLYYFVNNFSIALKEISTNLRVVSDTLLKLNARMESLEERVKNLEGGVRHEL